MVSMCITEYLITGYYPGGQGITLTAGEIHVVFQYSKVVDEDTDKRCRW